MTTKKRLIVSACSLALLLLAIALVQQSALPQQNSPARLRASDSRREQPVTRENNPNYLARNPFYFEGKIDYELLGIDEPADAWEYVQRGIHRQDDLEDYGGAIADYRRALEMNNRENGTCQIVTAVPENFNALDPAPCMFTFRLRLGYLLLHDEPAESIRLFREVLEIDPLRLEVHFLVAEAYEVLAEEAGSEQEQAALYARSIEELRAELALTPPVNNPRLSPDQANNAHTHWLLAEIYEKLAKYSDAIDALENYLKATRWHSDVLPWRTPLAEKKIEELREMVNAESGSDHAGPAAPARARIRRDTASPSQLH